ncbi:MAG: ABC transporter substrate-binding protein [Alphaproteobacteria bacterium]|nr:ABC transporter substrate-binding protein [Alphaproteobacteria bacterium]
MGISKVLTLTLGTIAMSVAMYPGTQANAQELADDQTLVIGGVGADIKTLDPMFQTETMNDVISHYMYSYLTQSPYGTMDFQNIEGDLAESWEILEGGKVWVFKIKQGVYFHDGNDIFAEGEAPELNAEDVKFSFDRMLDPELGSPHRGEYDVIESIEVVDSHTVKFNLKFAYAFFDKIQTYDFKAGAIISKAAAEKMEGTGNWGFAYTIGTGPFEFVEYVPKEKVVLKANEDYFKGAPTIQNVEYRFMPDLNSRTLAFIAGEIDTVYGVRDPEWARNLASAVPEATVDKVPLGSGGVLHYNMTREPLNDIRVRKALSLAICRQTFADLFGPVRVEQTSIVPASYEGSLPKETMAPELLYECDLDEAKRLLDESGHGDGIKLWVSSSPRPTYRTVYVAVQEAWRKLGVELEIEMVDHTSYISNVKSDKNDVVAYSADRTPIADSYLTEFWHSSAIVGTPTGQKNFSHYGALDADGDGLVDSIDWYIEEARKEVDPDRRRSLWELAQQKVLEDAAAKPLHVLIKVLGRQSWVDLGVDFTGTMAQTYPLERARILKH